MAGLGFCPCFTSPAGSKRYSLCSSPVTRKCRRKKRSHLTGKQLRKVVGVEKRGPRHLDFGQELSLLWLSNQFRSVKVQFRRSTLEAQSQGGLPGRQGAASPRSGGELQSLCEEGQLDRAMDLLMRMDQQGIVAPLDAYRALLKGCTRRKVSSQAKQLHTHLVKNGLDFSRMLGEYVVNMLVKCGDLEGALQAFHRLPSRTAFSWTAIISGYTSSGKSKDALEMYRCMQDQGVEPNKYTIIAGLRACGSLPDVEEGKRIHAEALKYRYESDLFVGTCLVDMYAKCGNIVDAQTVFDGLSEHDVVSWNALLPAYTQEGEAEKALQLYGKMREEGASPDDRTYVCALQACGLVAEKEEQSMMNEQNTRVKALIVGKVLHADAVNNGYSFDVFVRSALVSMYGRCGSTVDAQNVFDSLSKSDVVSWNAMLALYAQHGHSVMAWQMYEEMREEGESPNDRTFVTGLQVCGMLAENEENVLVEGQRIKPKSLEKGKIMHADTCRKGFDSDVFVGSVLVSMYGKCGSIFDAQGVFDGLSKRNVVSWNAMLTTYAHQGYAKEAMELYEQMQNEGVSPSDRTCVTILQACSILAEDEEEMRVDGQLIKSQSLQIGKVMHAYVQIKGYHTDAFVGNALMSMYGKCLSSIDAQTVFDGLSKRDVVSWNAILAAYTEQGQAQKALLLYEQMQQELVGPNDRTLVNVLQACAMLAEKGEDDVDGELSREKSLNMGKAAHAFAQKYGYDSDIFVANAVITMYGKCRKTVDAQVVFEGLASRDVVSWNAMISMYVQQDQAENALQLYDQMCEEGMIPNLWTFLSVFQACGILAKTEGVMNHLHTQVKYLEKGMAVHADAWRAGYQTNILAGTSLIRMYGKCGSVVEARKVFDELPQRSAVVWTAMLNVYAQHGQRENAQQLCTQMHEEGMSLSDGPGRIAERTECFPDGISSTTSAETEKAVTL